MKYLKGYKLFESKGFFVDHTSGEYPDEIRDYFSDLFEDGDFEVEIGRSWGLDNGKYKQKYEDRTDGKRPFRIIIHKIKNNDEYKNYYYSEIKPNIDRASDMLSDVYDCIVDQHEKTRNGSILYTDIILIPKGKKSD